MKSIQAFVEIGQKKTFAGAIDWPGWCRSGRDEQSALQALVDYGPRYAGVMHNAGIAFQAPASVSGLAVAERHKGNASTDFGVPMIVLDADQIPPDRKQTERFQAILKACWQAFDDTVQNAGDRELRKGPRGGGRETGQIVAHVLEADVIYLAKIGWKYPRTGEKDPAVEFIFLREAIIEALDAALKGELPAQGPRGGTLWPARYFVRRLAWHVVDHAWEIEDRIA